LHSVEGACSMMTNKGQQTLARIAPDLFADRFSKSNPHLQKEKMQNSESLTASLQPFAKIVSRMLKHLERNVSHPNSLISAIPRFQNTG